MKKNRYLLCLLACGFMLYFAVPRLSIASHGAKEAFTIVWILFMFIAIAGNLTGLLYYPQKHVKQTRQLQKQHHSKKTRSFH